MLRAFFSSVHWTARPVGCRHRLDALKKEALSALVYQKQPGHQLDLALQERCRRFIRSMLQISWL
ncbi:hypothetical protein CSZ94_20860 [Janthinobacterium sp. ROICE36]|nr:hypothetical protein CSZ94_20860 [Janthinobacterium sp. ROICE36]